MKCHEDMLMMIQNFIFQKFIKKPEGSIKQGSSEETVKYDITGTIEYTKQTYKNLLREGIIPEMSTTTKYVYRVVLEWNIICQLRCKDDSQRENKRFKIDKLVKEKFPVSWDIKKIMNILNWRKRKKDDDIILDCYTYNPYTYNFIK